MSDQVKEQQIRFLRADELNAWLALMNEARRDCPGYEPLVALDYARMRERGDLDPAGPLVAVRDGALVASVSFAAGKTRGRLRDLAVRADSRRQGVAHALVDAAMVQLRERGIRLIEAQDWDVPRMMRSTTRWSFAPPVAICSSRGI